jgi:uncharacterized repeat protein (TIGR03803 family)
MAMRKPLSLSLIFAAAACSAGGISTNVASGPRTFADARDRGSTQFTVLHSFTGPTSDGSYPSGGLIEDQNRDLIGTTFYGGSQRQCNGSTACGTVYESRAGSQGDRLLYTFSGPPDGELPISLISSNGMLYGATQYGGAANFGAIFRLEPSAQHPNKWNETILYSFKGPPSDGQDVAGLFLTDQSGSFYGVTFMGGSATTCFFAASGCGTVFRLSPPSKTHKSWQESVLHSFTGVPDGAGPTGLAWSGATIYGTTDYGGTSTECPYLQGCGTLYTLAKAGGKHRWRERVVHSFNLSGSQFDGSIPSGKLVAAKNGTIYGTTAYGGGMGSCTVEKGLNYCGTLYAFAAGARSRARSGESVLYAFKGAPLDGAQPGSFMPDGHGGFYGVTSGGGTGSCQANTGCGTVYELSPPARGKTAWKERVLHSFQGAPADGFDPLGSLVLLNHTLYGVTDLGGSGPCAFGCGTIYSLRP